MRKNPVLFFGFVKLALDMPEQNAAANYSDSAHHLGIGTAQEGPRIDADKLNQKFDVVLLSCKAFDLEDAIKSFAPAVGPQTSIIPLLNGMRHLDVLDGQFGTTRVLGGQCAIAVTLNDQREIVHLNPMQSLSFGERDGKMTDRVSAIAEIIKSGNFNGQATDNILQEMWEKWVFLTTLAASNSVMRAPVGIILASPGGKEFMLGVKDECASVAAAAGHPPREAFHTRVNGMLTTEGSPLTASMYRDIRSGAPIEADQIVGDMIARADAAKAPVPKLRVIYTHLKAYEKQRG